MAKSQGTRLDKTRVASLYEEHAPGLRRFLLGVLKDRDVADEALQQTFVRVLEQGHEAEESRMKSWVYQVAFNLARELRRRDGARARAVNGLLDAIRSHRDAPPHGEPDAELPSNVHRALAGLPAAQREVLDLRILDELSFVEIAARLGIPLGTALTRMRLALKRVRRELDR